MSSPISSIQLFLCHLHTECERRKRKQCEWRKRKRERGEKDGGLVAANPSSGPFKYLNVHARCAYSFCLSFSFVQLFTYFFPMPTCHNILFLNSIGPSSGTKTTHGNGKRHDEEDSEENQFNDWHRWWIFQYIHFPYIAYDVSVCYAVRKRNKYNFLNYVYRYTVCYVLWRLVLRIKWKILSSVNSKYRDDSHLNQRKWILLHFILEWFFSSSSAHVWPTFLLLLFFFRFVFWLRSSDCCVRGNILLPLFVTCLRRWRRWSMLCEKDSDIDFYFRLCHFRCCSSSRWICLCRFCIADFPPTTNFE